MIRLKSLSWFFIIFPVIVTQAQTRKAPAYPLITHDPYFSIWSFSDELNASSTVHWTGAEQSLTGYIKVDGKVYRFMGQESKSYDVLLPAADDKAYSVRYTESAPAGSWFEPEFNDSKWRQGMAPFGDDKSMTRTPWESEDLWVRREFVSAGAMDDIYLKLSHDDNITVYLNGKEILARDGWVHKYIYIPIKNASSLIKKGKNVLAVHIRNTAGGRHLDFGLVKEKKNLPATIAKAVQKNITLHASQTIYDFACGPVDLKVTFTSPLILNDPDLLARPVSYISFEVKSNNGAAHNVELLTNTSSGLAVNTPDQEVVATRYNAGGLSFLKAGTTSQPVLAKKGDDLRIDWGYVYVAVPQGSGHLQYLSSSEASVLAGFMKGQGISATDKIIGKQLSLATVIRLGKIKSSGAKIMIGYDDIWAIQYFGKNLRPWWNRNNQSGIEEQFLKAHNEYANIISRCNETDQMIYRDAFQSGGEEYARLCEMAYRHAIAAHKLVESPQGTLLWLSKENYSNGCINTVDLTYPSAPLFLLYNPELVKGMMNGIFYYSESGKWKKPFAAHDIGTYPLANGQVYGEDMPVEESGNMVILAAALAKTEGNADYAQKHWETLTTWTNYLVREGFDPANQLCTDDFAGHLARNANLSLKAIMAIEGYAMLAKMLGKQDLYEKYHAIAVNMVPEWMRLANDGDHYSLAFEKKNTWSQKYNLVWDRVLQFHIFPKEVVQKEMKFYLKNQNTYGLPLDSRKTYTKSDWIIWTGCLTGEDSDFRALVKPLYKYALETSSRVPMSDWYETTNAKKVNFQARSVIGGYWMKVLDGKLNGK